MPNAARRPPLALLDLAVVGGPLALLYLATLSRDLGTVDSGELAVVCARLGIAHPTGYPLYTLLGRIAVRWLPGAPISDLNLLSAVCAVAAAVLAAGLARDVLRALGVEAGAARWPALGAGWLFGTNAVYWDQATGNEVYALHLVFVVLLLRLALRLARPGATPRDLLALAWVSGLALANHLSIVFLAPALAWCAGRYLLQLRSPGGQWKGAQLTATAVAAGLAAWTVVLYLPVRAAGNPILEWGAPDGWARFWRHLLGRQYSVWMFESAAQWGGHLRGYLSSWPARFCWPLLALAGVGVWAIARSRSPVRWVVALAFLVPVLWASTYDIHDLEPYYLPSDVVLAVLAAVGAVEGGRLVRRRQARESGATWASGERAARLGLVAVLALVAGLQAALHFREANRRDDRFVRFHAEATLRSLPPGTVLFSRFWDALVSPGLYLQEIEGLRRDVAIVDVELLRRSWYYPQLIRWDAALLTPIADRVSVFQERVAVFEAGRPYDAASIEESFRGVIAGLARAHRPARPTACTADAEAELRGQGVLVPEGLVSVLRDGPDEVKPLAPPDVDGLLRSGYRPRDPIHRMVVRAWAQAIASRIRFLEVMGRTEELPAWQEAFRRVEPAAKAAIGSAPPS